MCAYGEGGGSALPNRSLIRQTQNRCTSEIPRLIAKMSNLTIRNTNVCGSPYLITQILHLDFFSKPFLKFSSLDIFRSGS